MQSRSSEGRPPWCRRHIRTPRRDGDEVGAGTGSEAAPLGRPYWTSLTWTYPASIIKSITTLRTRRRDGDEAAAGTGSEAAPLGRPYWTSLTWTYPASIIKSITTLWTHPNTTAWWWWGRCWDRIRSCSTRKALLDVSNMDLPCKWLESQSLKCFRPCLWSKVLSKYSGVSSDIDLIWHKSGKILDSNFIGCEVKNLRH